LAAGLVAGVSGTGTGTGAETGAGLWVVVCLASCSCMFCRWPSPKNVAEIMKKMVDMIRIKNLSGFFKKNKGHLGFIIPIMKKIIVYIPM
jgi:hypothetical protein